ncbi:ATP-binding protein [Catenuloplanes atrovinosus]|uniref:Two-component sensor histidine kinase n=1 Tax=Catenuloplanes atrovinosus TaxID=137266 RepID=A0AAE3YPU1_9ACTN|nr:ATP-binding protein [Catenuloplanes atrovinosus]MDR7277460.1 two-component sensor histidine kinase [Catenuloplanes atrovinosus]
MTRPRTLRANLLPLPGAARQARDLATEACLLWSLPHLIVPIALIASELAANAVEHAGTMTTLTVTRHVDHLRVSAVDGSPVPPTEARPGSGLALLQACASQWGWRTVTGGKEVWAVLSTD